MIHPIITYISFAVTIVFILAVVPPCIGRDTYGSWHHNWESYKTCYKRGCGLICVMVLGILASVSLLAS